MYLNSLLVVLVGIIGYLVFSWAENNLLGIFVSENFNNLFNLVDYLNMALNLAFGRLELNMFHKAHANESLFKYYISILGGLGLRP